MQVRFFGGRGAREELLVQAHPAVEDVAAGRPEAALQIVGACPAIRSITRRAQGSRSSSQPPLARL